jgi:uncharacterized repeat protein (TIGR01451 family)
MPLSKAFLNRKIFSIVLVTLMSLSTLLPLTKESLPASLAGNGVLISTTVTYSAVDYTADSPASGPLVSPGSPVTYFVDFSNSTGSDDPVSSFTLNTTNHSSWAGTATCSYIVSFSGQDHTTLDFDTLGMPCSFDGSYTITGMGFPTTLAVAQTVYLRITGLSVGNSSIGFTTRANGEFSNNDIFTDQRNAAYVRVGGHIITGQIFNDANMDAIHAPAELGLAGIGVTLIQEIAGNNSDPIVNSKVTDENGYYAFGENDSPGFSLFSSYRITALSTLSNRLTTNNNIQAFPILAAGTHVAEDIGFRVAITSEVGDRVWIDTDGDGIQDSGTEESGVGGVHLELMSIDSILEYGNDDSGVGGVYSISYVPPNTCLGRNVNQAGGSTGNVEVSYPCNVQPGGEYYLTFRTDTFCLVDHSAFRLLDADDNVLAEGSCNRSGYPNTLIAESIYRFGPFTENQAGLAHLNVIDDYGDLTFLDLNWNYTGPIGFDAYLRASDIPSGYTVSPADQGSNILDSDFTSEESPGVFRTNNFFFQFDNFNRDMDLGLIGEDPTATDILLEKTVDAPSTGSGDIITYTITVTNLSPTVTASGVTVNDLLPSQVTYTGQTATIGVYDQNTGEWPVGDLLPSTSAQLEITATINDANTPTITNNASATTTTSESNISNNSDSAAIIPTAPVADISITKLANAPTPSLGNVITYTITASNNSSTDIAYGMTVTDHLPGSVTFVSQATTSGTYNPLTGIWLVGDVGINNSHTLVITATINDDSDTISNTATISSLSQDPDLSNNSSTADVIPTPEPSPSPSPTPSESPTPSPSPTASPSPSPSVTPSPTPSSSHSPIATSTSNSSGGSGGGIVNPGGITIINGSNNSSSNSGWRYSNNTNSSRRSSSHKQSQVTTTIPPVPPVPAQDPLTCLVANGTRSIDFLDIETTTDQKKTQFLTSILNTASNSRIIQGYGNQSYGMGKVLTRFELTKIALQANCLQPNQLTPNQVFSDVPQDNSEMSLIVGTAQSLGIVTGKDGKFYPNQAVTYAEMSKILLSSGYYFQGQAAPIVYSSSFPGVTDESFIQYAEYAVRLQLVSLNNGIFPQNAPIYRDTMLQVLSRYISYLKNISLN